MYRWQEFEKVGALAGPLGHMFLQFIGKFETYYYSNYDEMFKSLKSEKNFQASQEIDKMAPSSLI